MKIWDSVVEQAKFDYSSLGKDFNQGLTEEDKKERLLESVENIGNRKEELLKEVNNQRIKESGDKDRKAVKTKNPLIYDNNHSFYQYRLSEFSQILSIESKFDMIVKCCKAFINLMDVGAEPGKIKYKFDVLDEVSKLYGKLISEYKNVFEIEPKDDKSNSWKKKYSPKNLKTLDYEPAKLQTESLSDENRSDIKQPTQLKQLKLNEIPKSLMIKVTRKDFISLIIDVANNLDNEDCKTTVGGSTYDLKNSETFLLEIINKKISKNEARKLYNNLIKPDIDALIKSASRGKNKRENILNVLNNLEPVILDGVYFNYYDKPELESEKNIAEKAKLRRQRFDEISKKKMIYPYLFRNYFGYLSPSNMYKALGNTKSTERNKAQVDLIKDRLTNLKRNTENTPKSDVEQIEMLTKIRDVDELILYFNNENQKGSGLKILTPNQMLSGLPITLAHLKARNNSEKPKNETR